MFDETQGVGPAHLFVVRYGQACQISQVPHANSNSTVMASWMQAILLSFPLGKRHVGGQSATKHAVESTAAERHAECVVVKPEGREGRGLLRLSRLLRTTFVLRNGGVFFFFWGGYHGYPENGVSFSLGVPVSRPPKKGALKAYTPKSGLECERFQLSTQHGGIVDRSADEPIIDGPLGRMAIGQMRSWIFVVLGTLDLPKVFRVMAMWSPLHCRCMVSLCLPMI